MRAMIIRIRSMQEMLCVEEIMSSTSLMATCYFPAHETGSCALLRIPPYLLRPQSVCGRVTVNER